MHWTFPQANKLLLLFTFCWAKTFERALVMQQDNNPFVWEHLAQNVKLHSQHLSKSGYPLFLTFKQDTFFSWQFFQLPLFQLTQSLPWRLWWGTATTRGSRTSPTLTSRSTSRTPTSPWTTTLMERLDNSLNIDNSLLFMFLFCRAQRRTITWGLVNCAR